MDVKPWHKFETTRFLSLMQSHSNKRIGMWWRVYCTLSNSKTPWEKTGNIEMWARIIAENVPETRRFINYIIDHIPDMSVSSQLGTGNEKTFTIKDVYHHDLEDITVLQRNLTKKQTRTKLADNRIRLKNMITEAYHPAKRNMDVNLAGAQFLKIMRDASRDQKLQDDKIVMENSKVDEILEAIEIKSKTPEWAGGHEFLETLGVFLQSRSWENMERRHDAK
jgi:hypothetical protein